MTEQFVNNAESALAADMAANDATLSVLTGAGAEFPSTGTFRLRIENEILIATARASDTITVTRGAEGTTAAAHPLGAIVRAIITAGALAQLKTDLLAVAAGGALPTGRATIDVSAGGTINLTSGQIASGGLLEFTGALPSATTITVPTTTDGIVRSFRNATSGIYPLSVKAFGSGSVVTPIPQGGEGLFYISGTELRPIGNPTNPNESVTVTANATLLPWQKHCYIGVIGGPITLELPAAPTLDEEHSFTCVAGDVTSTNTATIDGNGKAISGGTTLVLSTPYESGTVRYNGSSWSVV